LHIRLIIDQKQLVHLLIPVQLPKDTGPDLFCSVFLFRAKFEWMIECYWRFRSADLAFARMRGAVIDIGTNSVKLLVAEVEQDRVLPLLEESEQTRLGQGFYQANRLQAQAIDHTAQAVGRFASKARHCHVDHVRVIATSAARDAVNQADLLRAVRNASGLEVEVISGEQEADWAFTGVQTDPALRDRALLILDVGGGSSEFIVGESAPPRFRRSFPIGTVRLMEQIVPADPPLPNDWTRCHTCLEEALQRDVRPVLQPPLDELKGRELLLVGTGGTTSILAAMELGLRSFDRERIEQVRLTRRVVHSYQERLWGISLQERRRIAGLPPNRADVILFGVAIFLVVMDLFGFDQVRVSTRGLRFAAVKGLPAPSDGRTPVRQ
jgi:exopolyphosphatase/guanosine-5'-triphosphate,3'-diphosphate pyrophosphatase